MEINTISVVLLTTVHDREKRNFITLQTPCTILLSYGIELDALSEFWRRLYWKSRAGEALATQKTGKDPSDGIFVSDTLLNSRCEFLGFNDGVVARGDHQCWWIDILYPFEIKLYWGLVPSSPRVVSPSPDNNTDQCHYQQVVAMPIRVDNVFLRDCSYPLSILERLHRYTKSG
jgi:hypothetical protein